MAQVRSLLKVRVEGVKRIVRQLNIVEERLGKEVGKALYAEGRNLIKAAGEEVPKDTLALFRSRFVTPPIRKEGMVQVICGFGTDSVINPKTKQPTSHYALYVHERLDVHHPVGKAKFLEDPANRLKPYLERNVANRIARVLKG